MARAIRNIHTGEVVAPDQVDHRYYKTEEVRQRLLDGMVDGSNWMYADEKIEVNEKQATKYINEKLQELVEREARVEAKEAELAPRFANLIAREMAVEDKERSVKVEVVTPEIKVIKPVVAKTRKVKPKAKAKK